eukprot:11160_6
MLTVSSVPFIRKYRTVNRRFSLRAEKSAEELQDVNTWVLTSYLSVEQEVLFASEIHAALFHFASAKHDSSSLVILFLPLLS